MNESLQSSGTSRISSPICVSVCVAIFVSVVATLYTWGHDLEQYRVAANLYWSGLNPYDSVLLAARAPLLGHVGDVAPIYQPPTTLLLMSLFFGATGDSWRGISAGLQVIFAGFLLALIRRLLHVQSLRTLSATALVASFLPFVELLIVGQLDLLILVAFLSAILSIKYRRSWLSGGCLALCLLKPHPIFLGLLVVSIYCIRARHWRVFVSSFLVSGTVVILAWWVNPVAWSGFFTMPYSPLEWVPASLIAPLRLIYFYLTGTIPTSLALIPALAAAVVCIVWAFSRDLDKLIDLHGLITWLLISLLVLPYGFIYDHVSALLVPLVLLYRGEFRQLPVEKLYLAIIAALWISVALGWEDWRTFWFPVVMLGLWLFADSRAVQVANFERNL